MILVTGAAGSIGSHVVKHLLNRNQEVVCFVRPEDDLKRLKNLKVSLAFGRVEDIKSIESAMNNHAIEYVIHCAALVSDWAPKADFVRTNVTGVKNMLTVAKDNKKLKRFTHISTSDVYGAVQEPADETAPYMDVGIPYVSTKIQGEKLVWEFYHTYNLPITVIRPGSVIGPGDNPICSELIRYLKIGILLIEDGQADAGLVYVDNIAEGIISATFSEKTIGQAYNLTDGYGVNFKKFIDDMAKQLGIPYKRYNVGYRTAYALAYFFECIYSVLPKKFKPPLTREAVLIMAHPQNHPATKARRDFNYLTTVDYDTAIKTICDSHKSTLP